MTNVQILEHQVVPFAGSEILAAKTHDGKIFAAVKWVSEGLQLSDGQIRNERKRVQEDPVLQKGVQNLVLPTNGGLQSVLCIEIEFLPMWLAKISITPTMKKETPWIADRLIEFQIKAKNVLAEAFFPKQRVLSPAEILLQNAQQLVLMEREVTDIKNRTAIIEENQNNIAEILKMNHIDWRNQSNVVINRIAIKRGGGDEYKNVRNEIYDKFEKRAHCRLEIRLANRQKNALAKGMNKTVVSKISKLDIIDEDPRLVEIYLTIVKEFAITLNVRYDEVAM